MRGHLHCAVVHKKLLLPVKYFTLYFDCMRAAANLYDTRVFGYNTAAACVGMISGQAARVGMIPSHTNISLFSGPWGQFGFTKDQIPQDPFGSLDFGRMEDQKTKTKPELALSQTPYFAWI